MFHIIFSQCLLDDVYSIELLEYHQIIYLTLLFFSISCAISRNSSFFLSSYKSNLHVTHSSIWSRRFYNCLFRYCDRNLITSLIIYYVEILYNVSKFVILCRRLFKSCMFFAWIMTRLTRIINRFVTKRIKTTFRII
jgi:hypothetical protein